MAAVAEGAEETLLSLPREPPLANIFFSSSILAGFS